MAYFGFGPTTKLTLRLLEFDHNLAREWADRDGVSLNDWIAAAVSREAVRRSLLAHNDWVKDNPLYSTERWQARQREIEAAKRPHRDGRDAA